MYKYVCTCMNMGTCAHTHELMVFCSLSQVSALFSPRKMENLISMKAECQLHVVGSVKWVGSTFGTVQKSQLGKYELEPLRKILHNLVGFRLWGRTESDTTEAT